MLLPGLVAALPRHSTRFDSIPFRSISFAQRLVDYTAPSYREQVTLFDGIYKKGYKAATITTPATWSNDVSRNKYVHLSIDHGPF